MNNKTSTTSNIRSIVYFLLASVLLFACGTKDRTQDAVKWITEAPKPIKVYNHRMNGWSYERDYTLIDSSGAIFYTGSVSLTLPDTIH